MKSYLAVVCFAGIVGLGLCQPSFNSFKFTDPHTLIKRSASFFDKFMSKKIEDLFTNETIPELIEAVCPGKLDEIQIAVTKVITCFQNIKDDSTVCDATNEYKLCLGIFAPVLDDCFPAPYKGISNLLIDSKIAQLKFVCESSGATALELFNICQYKGLTKKSKLIEQLIIEIDKFQKGADADTIVGICQLSKAMLQFAEDVANENCRNPKTKEALRAFYEAGFSPCKEILR